MKHKHITDLVANFYGATKDLSEPIVVTKRGNPVMTISATAKNFTPIEGGAMFEAQSMSVFNSSGFSDEDAQKMAKQMRTLFENNTQIPQNTAQGEEVQNEEKHNHNR